MPSRHREVHLPIWLWFFAAIPIGLVVVLLWQRRRLPAILIKPPVPPVRRARYVEPDSIPIDTRPPYDMDQMEEAYHAEYVSEATHGQKGTKPETKTVVRLSPQPVFNHPVQKAEDTSSTISEPSDFENLQIIEGIGPKISGLLTENGITTFRLLAETPLEKLDQILIDANLRRLANPDTWPEQARLAADGDWDKLKQLQNTLKAGRKKS